MHDLGATTVFFIVDRGEIIFQIDTGTDRTCIQQDILNNFAFGIRRWIIGNQKSTAIKEGALTQ